MGNLSTALAQLRVEHKRTQQQLEELDQAIQVVQRLVQGHGTIKGGVRHTLSLAARRKIADAQRARWARVRAKQEKKAAA